METLDGPDQGGPEDRDATNKDGRWIDIRKRCKSALVRGKGGGKGSSEHGNDMQTQVQSQGRERTATENDFFERHKMHKAPVLITNANGTPVSIQDISDTDTQNEVRLNAQGAVKAMHIFLKSEHGPLDHAAKPTRGQIVPAQIKIEDLTGELFAQPEWTQILEEELKTDFIGFFPGSIVGVITRPGMQPICHMTCLVLKSERTQDLQTNPRVDASYTMYGSRKKVKCSISLLEMPLSCPTKGELAVSLQIIQPFLNHKDFAVITARYKRALAEVLCRGIWKHLTQGEIMDLFTICKTPKSRRYITRKDSKRVYVLEVFGFSDGDVTYH